MKESIYMIIFLAVAVATVWFWIGKNNLPKNDLSFENGVLSEALIEEGADDKGENAQSEEKIQEEDKNFQFPLDRAEDRVIKKPFGIFITPQNSPVQPENFSGYHTGTDFEIFPDELEVEVVIKAVCSGKLLVKRTATGYGGLAVQSCDLDGSPITVAYGHLKLQSIEKAVGDDIAMGEPLGVLGRAYSIETGGERKHLHLGLHKGSEINILGYVASKNLLSNWLDPMIYLR